LALRVESFVLGVCLLLLGCAWTAANLGLVELLPTLHTYWPLAFVIWGLAELVNTWLSRSGRRS